MKTKIPPPVITLISVCLIFLSKPLFSSYQIVSNLEIGTGVCLMGLFILIFSVRLFKMKKTSINPLNPKVASTLVVSGLFKFSRNPMYCGMLFLIFGISIIINIIGGFFISTFFILYMNRYQIIPEEEALVDLFGADYKNYKERVRRWV